MKLQKYQKEQKDKQKITQNSAKSNEHDQISDHPFLHAQGIIGNHGLLRLCGADTIQPRLKIGKSRDQYEREAERMADMVVRMPHHHNSQQVPSSRGALSQKQSNSRSVVHSGNIPDSIKAVIGLGRREPLDEPTRGYMESRFGGQDFSDVRIHTDSGAAESATSIGAKAYTVGNDIVFSKGQYDTYTTTGMKLLAHELVHVCQQRAQPKVQAQSVRETPFFGEYYGDAFVDEDMVKESINSFELAGDDFLRDERDWITINFVKLLIDVLIFYHDQRRNPFITAEKRFLEFLAVTGLANAASHVVVAAAGKGMEWLRRTTRLVGKSGPIGTIVASAAEILIESAVGYAFDESASIIEATAEAIDELVRNNINQRFDKASSDFRRRIHMLRKIVDKKKLSGEEKQMVEHGTAVPGNIPELVRTASNLKDLHNQLEQQTAVLTKDRIDTTDISLYKRLALALGVYRGEFRAELPGKQVQIEEQIPTAKRYFETEQFGVIGTAEVKPTPLINFEFRISGAMLKPFAERPLEKRTEFSVEQGGLVKVRCMAGHEPTFDIMEEYKRGERGVRQGPDLEFLRRILPDTYSIKLVNLEYGILSPKPARFSVGKEEEFTWYRVPRGRYSLDIWRDRSVRDWALVGDGKIIVS